MPTLVASAKSDVVSTPAPAGTHMARCVHVIDLGTQHNETFGKSQHKIRIGFELPTKTHVFDEKRGPEPFLVSREFTLSLGDKSALRPFLEGWRGRAFTDAELDGFDIGKLLDKPCLLSVVHKPKAKGGGVYANINSVSPPMDGVPVPDRKLALIFYTIDQGENETYKALPTWVQDKLKASLEFKGNGNGSAPADEPEQDEPEPEVGEDTPF